MLGFRSKESERTILLVGWLLFFPNAPYIITDLLRLGKRAPVPIWYDLMVIFSFAWNGLILGFTSLWIVQQIIQQRFGVMVGWVMDLVTLTVSGFGIHLGRFLRWNSCDMLTAPNGLATDIIARLANPVVHPTNLGGDRALRWLSDNRLHHRLCC